MKYPNYPTKEKTEELLNDETDEQKKLALAWMLMMHDAISEQKTEPVKPICTDSSVGEYKCECGCAVSVSYDDPDNDEDYFMFNYCPDCGKQMDWDAVDDGIENQNDSH